MSDKTKRHDAVDRFAQRMKRKLDRKAGEGYHGWDTGCLDMELEDSLQHHCTKLIRGDRRQAVDIANLAMFLWYRKYGANE